MELVKLRNRTEESRVLVAGIKLSIESLWEESPVYVVELANKCKDRDYTVFGDSEKVLKEFAMMQPDGNIHLSIRNVVLSMVEGEGMDMRLVSPVA